MKKIIFDATIFANGVHKNAGRSGLFVTAVEIFKELLTVAELQIYIYASPSTRSEVKDFILKNFSSFQGVFIGDYSINYLCKLRSFIERKNSEPNKKYKQLFFHGCAILCKCLCYVVDRFASCPVSSAELKKYDGFFSPVYLAPRFIRKSTLPRFTILYDTIPKLFPQFCPSTRVGLSWNYELIDNLNEHDYCFAISRQTKRDFLRFNSKLRPENITIIPLAADEKRFYPCRDLSRISAVRKKYCIPDNPYFLSLCTIEPRKNLIFALEVFETYLAENPDSDLLFVLAGGHWNRFSSKWKSALARMQHIKEHIVLPGYIDDDDLAPLFSGAEFFIYPSIYEGFGLPPLEAMQCGCPVISSNTSSLPEVMGDVGIMIKPDHVGDAVQAMKKMLQDNCFRNECIEKGLDRAKLFRWSFAVDIINDTIRGIYYEH